MGCNPIPNKHNGFTKSFLLFIFLPNKHKKQVHINSPNKTLNLKIIQSTYATVLLVVEELGLLGFESKVK